MGRRLVKNDNIGGLKVLVKGTDFTVLTNNPDIKKIDCVMEDIYADYVKERDRIFKLARHGKATDKDAEKLKALQVKVLRRGIVYLNEDECNSLTEYSDTFGIPDAYVFDDILTFVMMMARSRNFEIQ